MELEQRDRFFLELAREIVVKEGFLALTMSRLAEESGFTRGTLYQRFGSREGVLVELWIECLTELDDLMKTAAGLEGTTRERATAVFEAVMHYFRSYPENLSLLGAVRPGYVAAALSDDQRARLAQ